MKKLSKARILILVLSLALILGAVFCISAAAEETPEKGSFGSISIAHADKVAIRVEVNATVEELNNETVVVSYTLNGETKNAEYYMTDGEGRVWVITEGIAIYDLGQTVTFSSTVNGEVVESGRTYSVAQFLYKMLYVEEDIDEKDYNVYKYLLAYGEAAQIAHEKNLDKLVTASTVAFTNNANITINGMSSAFAPAASLEVTPKWNGHLDEGMSVDGWIIKDGEGQREVDSLTFTCTGVVEIIEPTLYVHTHTEAAPVVENNVDPTCTKDGSYDSVVYCSECGGEVRRTEVAVDAIGHDYSDVAYTWSADNTTCAAVQVCVNDASHTANEETAIVHQIALHVTADGVTYTYAVDFENYAAQTKTVEGDVAISDGLATVVAPTVAGRMASHEYVMFNLHDENAEHDFVISYSEFDTWDGSVADAFASGSGTEEDPYIIMTGAQLAYLASIGKNDTAYYKLGASLDLSGHNWTPIAHRGSTTGFSWSYFNGHFDGAGHRINFSLTQSSGRGYGLFEGLGSASVVKNLILSGSVSTNDRAGALAYITQDGAKIENVTNYASVTIKKQSSTNAAGYVGGIVGSLSGATTVATNCVNYGNVTSASANYTAGIAGTTSGTIKSCVNYGSVDGGKWTSGIAGCSSVLVEDCINYGDINHTAAQYGGGVVGHNMAGTVNNCVNYGDITSSVKEAGGVVGYSSGSMTSCVNYGNVTATGTLVGGVVGNTKGATISNCFNYGVVTSGGSAGGITGQTAESSTIINCENYGETKASGGNCGGISGYVGPGSAVKNCVNHADVTSTSVDVGGIVGESKGDVQSSINYGAVHGTGKNVGGIVGLYNGENAATTDCENYGVVTGDGENVSGIVGNSAIGGTITNCTDHTAVEGGDEGSEE